MASQLRPDDDAHLLRTDLSPCNSTTGSMGRTGSTSPQLRHGRTGPQVSAGSRTSQWSARTHDGGGSGKISRSYVVNPLSHGGLWHKLCAFNPVLLLDMALPIFHPHEVARTMWDCIMLVAVLYIATITPLKISFHEIAELRGLPLLDLTVTALLAMDVVVNARTAFITQRGELVRDSRDIAVRYMRGMFVLDVVSCIPFSLIMRGSAHRYAVWAELMKLTRLRQLVWMLRSSGQHSNAVAMLRLMLYLSLSAHWACCFWHYLSEAIPGWPWMFELACPGCSDRQHYLIGLYSAFLLLLGDRPDTNNNVERIVVTCLLFVGTLLYAVVVGSMALLVSNIWATASRHKQRAAMVSDALRYRGIEPDMRGKVSEYFDHLASFNHPGSDGVAFLQELPVGLYGSVMASMFGPLLSQVQLFSHCERPFVWRLSQKLRLSLFMAGDVIYELGSVGHDMYIIWKGCVGLVAPGGCMAALLGDGQHFGELGLMAASMPRPHRAVALRPCDVVHLGRWDLQDAMKDFPDSAALVKERARCRMEDHEAPHNVWAFAMAAWGMQPGADGTLHVSHLELHNSGSGGGGAEPPASAAPCTQVAVGDEGEDEVLMRYSHGNGGARDDGGSGPVAGGQRPMTGGPVAEAREAAAASQGAVATRDGSTCGSLPGGATEVGPSLTVVGEPERAVPEGRSVFGLGARLLISFRGRKQQDTAADGGDGDGDDADLLRVDLSGLSRRMPSLTASRAAGLGSGPASAAASLRSGATSANLTAAQRRAQTSGVGSPFQHAGSGGPADAGLPPQNSDLGSHGSVAQQVGPPESAFSPLPSALRERGRGASATGMSPGHARPQSSRPRTLWLDTLLPGGLGDVAAGDDDDTPQPAKFDMITPFGGVQLAVAMNNSPPVGPRRSVQRLRSLVAPQGTFQGRKSLDPRPQRRKSMDAQSHALYQHLRAAPPTALPSQLESPLASLDDVWGQSQRGSAGGHPREDSRYPHSPQPHHQRHRRRSGSAAGGPQAALPRAPHARSPLQGSDSLAGSGRHSAALGPSVAAPATLASPGVVVPLSVSALAATAGGGNVTQLVLRASPPHTGETVLEAGDGHDPAWLAPCGAATGGRQARQQQQPTSTRAASNTGFTPAAAPARSSFRAATAASAGSGGAGPLFSRASSIHVSVLPRRSARGRSSTGFSLGRVSLDDDDDDSGWSSDGSGGGRRLVASLREQLGEANSRVVLLETQLAGVMKDPFQVPAIRAVFQREVRREVDAALARSTLAVDATLSEVGDKLLSMAVRAEDLGHQVTAADDRLRRLEDEQGGFQVTVVPAAVVERPSPVRQSGSGSSKMEAALRSLTMAGAGAGTGARGSSSGLWRSSATALNPVAVTGPGAAHRPSLLSASAALQVDAAVRSQSASGSVASGVSGGALAASAAAGARTAGARLLVAAHSNLRPGNGSDTFTRSVTALGVGLENDWASVASLLQGNQQPPSFMGPVPLHGPSRLSSRRDGGGSLRSRPVRSSSQHIGETHSPDTAPGHPPEDVRSGPNSGTVWQRHERAWTSSQLAL